MERKITFILALDNIDSNRGEEGDPCIEETHMVENPI